MISASSNILRKGLFVTAVTALLSSSLAFPQTQDELLLAAVKIGNNSNISIYLDGVKNPDIAEADGTTALHYAVLNNDISTANNLLQAGANINAKNRYGISAIYLAARNGSPTMTELLLNAGADSNEQYHEGETVLMTASRTGNYQTVELLLDHGADINAHEDWHGQTPLMWAVAQGHADLINMMASRGAEIDAESNLEEWERQTTFEPRAKWLPPGGMTPLLFAAREGCLDCLAPLLSNGANIDATTPKGITSLLIAIINGYYDVAWALIEAGADVNISDDTNRSPLYAAVDFNTMPESNRPSPNVVRNQHDSLSLISLLLENDADANTQLSSMAPYRLKLDRGTDSMLIAGTTPFLRAAKGADTAAMQLLLSYDADASLSTERGFNPLMTAAKLGTRESDTTGRYTSQEKIIAAIQVCLEQGLDINAKNNSGRSAIFGASMFGLDEVVEFLHQNGAELNYVDDRGFSPLDAAMGKAGGFGFVGADGVVQESTIGLIQQLL